MQVSLCIAQDQPGEENGNLFITTTRMSCEKTDITITSLCEFHKDDVRSLCFFQKFDFTDGSNRNAVRSDYFLNKEYRDDLAVGVEVSCAVGVSGSAIIISFSNFGSGRCTNCEWDQLYDLRGKLLASSRGSKSSRTQNDSFEMWKKKLDIGHSKITTTKIRRLLE